MNIWHHACADHHLAALADPPVKVPELPPDPLDEHGAPPAAHASPSTNGGPDLSPYTIRELANWYEEEAARCRVGLNLDQDALDRDLRRLLAERGVLPEFISTEFERVMKVVFPGSAPDPKPRPDPHEKRIAASGDAGGTVANSAAWPLRGDHLGPAG